MIPPVPVFLSRAAAAPLLWCAALLATLCCLWAAPGFCGQPRHLVSLTGGTEAGPLGRLGAVFYDESRGRLYVTDAEHHRILAYGEDFAFVSAFAVEGVLHWPMGVVKDARDRFFVSEPATGRVLVLEMARQRAEPLDMAAAGGANPVHPGHLALGPDGTLHVLDQANQRVLSFGPDLALRGQVRPDGVRDLRDVKAGPDGRLYLLDALRCEVLVCGSDGRVVRRFGARGRGDGRFLFPVSLAVDGRGRVYVLDRHAGRVSVFGRDGGFLHHFAGQGWREGRLHYPSYIAAGRDGRVFVVDAQNARVSVFE